VRRRFLARYLGDGIMGMGGWVGMGKGSCKTQSIKQST
jgi:hypothetical protein